MANKYMVDLSEEEMKLVNDQRQMTKAITPNTITPAARACRPTSHSLLITHSIPQGAIL